MATKTKTNRAGKVGVTPKGTWRATYNNSQGYDLLDEVLHQHDSWVSLSYENKDEPSVSSAKWFRSTEGGQNAYEQATLAASAADKATNAANTATSAATNADKKAALAVTAAGTANTAATNADAKATLAQQQADYAKQQGDYAKRRGDYPDQIRSDGYVWTYASDDAAAGADGYRRTDYKVDASLDFEALTPEQMQTLVDRVKENLVFATAAEAETAAQELT